MNRITLTHRSSEVRRIGASIRRRASAFSLSLWFLSAAVNPSISFATDGPKAVVSGTVENLGALPRGKPVVREFRIQNTGTEPLQISARANCGCTVASYDKTIPPGGTGKFSVELKTNALIGAFRKTVDVETNDSTLPEFVLEMRGESIPALQVSPDPNLPVELKWTETTAREFIVKTANGVALLDAATTDPAMKPKIEKTETGTYELKFEFPIDVPAGSQPVAITLMTDAEFEKSVPISLKLEKGLIVSPRELKLIPALGQARGSKKGSLIVRSASGPVQIVKASSADETLRVESKPIMEGKLYQVTVTELRPQAESVGKAAASRSIVLETNDPHQPRVEIPVR